MQKSVGVTRKQETSIQYIGNLVVLEKPMLGLFCSQRFPTELILKAYDLARELRDQGQVVISGFHSLLEKDMLSILLKGNQPVVYCLARNLSTFRVPSKFKPAMSDGQLVLLSPDYGGNEKRITRMTVQKRDDLILQMCNRLLVIHARPGGNTENLVMKAQSKGLPIFALSGQGNEHLFEAGVLPWLPNPTA